MRAHNYSLRRIARSLLAIAGGLLAGSAVSAPVQAASTDPTTVYYPAVTGCATTSQAGGTLFRSAPAGAGSTVTMVTGAVGDTVTIVNECALPIDVANYPQGPIDRSAAVTIAANSQGTFTINTSGAGARLGVLATTTSNLLMDAFVVEPSNGGGVTPTPRPRPASATAPQPVAAQLSLGATANSGFTCKDGSSVSGYVGQWLALPTDCSLPVRSNAKLLGWSTSADFPVAIAQRQVDKGWGTYELTNDAGQLTAVFIPAGHAALVSGGNTLHPIWSA